MCLDCGCQEGNEKKYFEHHHDHEHGPHTHTHDGHTHTHDGHTHSHDGHTHSHDGHTHSHDGHTHSHDGHTHSHDSADRQTRILEVEQSVLAKNDAIAEQNRTYLKNKGIVTINIISSPGSGKTTLLEKTLERLAAKVECSVIVGDQSTDNDAKRLKNKCENVFQIETNSSCHINAEQVAEVLDTVINDKTQLLFIENVGNLICPAAFDLGEDFKIAVLSTTEGEDKPVKYPVIFSDAQVVVLTKTDLIPYLDWDLKKCRQSIQQINPGVFTFELSSKSGEGMDAWIGYLEKLVC